MHGPVVDALGGVREDLGGKPPGVLPCPQWALVLGKSGSNSVGRVWDFSPESGWETRGPGLDGGGM